MRIRPLSRQQCPDNANRRRDEDEHDDVDVKDSGRRERACHQQQIQPILRLHDLAAKICRYVADDRRHARLHSRQHRAYPFVLGKRGVHHRDDADDDNRRQNCRQHRDNQPRNPGDAPPNEDGAVDGNRARCSLRQGGHVQHFLFGQVMQLINEFFLHQRYDDESAAESEGADEKHGRKERPKTVRFGFLFHQGGQLLF